MQQREGTTRGGIFDERATRAHLERVATLALATLDGVCAGVYFANDREPVVVTSGVEPIPWLDRFASHALLADCVTVINDVATDSRLASMAPDPATAWCIGAPITSENGRHVAVLCVAGAAPKSNDAARGSHLIELAAIAARELAIAEAAREAVHQHGDLADAQRILMLVLDTVPQRLFWKDVNGQYVGANRAFLADAGLSDTGELIGRSDFDELLPWTAAQAKACRDGDAQVIESGAPLNAMIEAQTRRDGREALIEVSRVPIRDERGEVIGVLGAYEDITSRYCAELQLRESEQRFRDVAAAAGEFIWEVDLDGTYTFVTDSIADTLGQSVESIVGCTPFDFMPDPDATRLRSWFGEMIELGEPFANIEHPVTARDGSVRWLRISGTPFRDSAGDLLGFRGAGLDITDQREAAAERDRFFDISVDLMSVMDTTGAFKRVNQAFCAAIGYRVEELRDATLHELVHPEDRAEAGRMLELLDAGRAVADFECRCRTRDGGHRWIQWRSVPDPVRGLIYSGATDVTDRRRHEDELRGAKEAAEAANRSKSEFLANMSHEIRTPMTAILGYADILAEEEGGGDEESLRRGEHLDTIRRNGEHLLSIINDILDISKIEAGRMTIEQIECDPFEIIADVASLLRPRAVDKGVELKVDFASALPEKVVTDPTRLRQVLVNLVGNSIKFTESGSVTIRASIDRATSSLWCDVVDTGIGMTVQQAERLFTPFVQADNTTTRRFGGTGLGLTISRRLAELLGGNVELVSSEPGEGSCFRVSIDPGSLAGVAMVERTAEALRPRKQRASGDRQIALRGRILLAEDGPDNQRLITFVLSKAGAEVVVAENGRLAVNAVLEAQQAGEPFDLVLMDMQMPELDGNGATRLLRDRGVRTPIVALTAHAMASHRSEAKLAGCDDYETKPIDKQRLLATCERWMGLAVATPR